MMVNNSAILTRDEYREFNDRVAILQGKGYDLPFEVEFIKKDDTFIGLDNFGVSGPGNEVFSHFNISIDRVKKEIVKIIKN